MFMVSKYRVFINLPYNSLLMASRYSKGFLTFVILCRGRLYYNKGPNSVVTN